MHEKPEVTLTIRLPRSMARDLDRTTIAYDLTPGEIVRRALEQYLSGQDHAAAQGASMTAHSHA